ncbi:MAG: VOC family protein, partial [Chloroflexi bacterium]|nr:VOC family protein [Chloroflexota bacterium]
MPVARLNHAVLYVRDATSSAQFYARVFGFEVVESAFGGRAVFMRSPSGGNH